MHRLIAAMLFSGLALAGTMPAQGQVHAGAGLAFGSDDVDFGIVGKVGFDLEETLENLEVQVEFAKFFPGDAGAVDVPGFSADVDYWELNANLLYHLPIASSDSFVPYLGGGLNIARASASVGFEGQGNTSSSATELGLNLLGGLRFGEGAFRPYAEAKFEFGGGEIFVLGGGIQVFVGD